MKKLHNLLAVGASTALFAGCGGEKTYEPITVPGGTLDMGIGWVEVGKASYEGRSFKVKSELAGRITCGAALEKQNNGSVDRIVVPKKITPAWDVFSQVDCYFDPGFRLSYDDVNSIKALGVKIVASS